MRPADRNVACASSTQNREPDEPPRTPRAPSDGTRSPFALVLLGPRSRHARAVSLGALGVLGGSIDGGFYRRSCRVSRLKQPLSKNLVEDHFDVFAALVLQKMPLLYPQRGTAC